MLELCRERGLTLATAESCTGGLVAARLTAVPGSSDVVLGGVVAYADEVKRELARRPGGDPRAARRRLRRDGRRDGRGRPRGSGADVAVSVTGVAGPGGGTPEKPVGLVYVHAEGPEGGRPELGIPGPGDREVDPRAARPSPALHLVRRLLTQSRHKDA